MFHKILIIIILSFIVFPVFSDIDVNDFTIADLKFDDAILKVKYFTLETIIVNCEIEVTTKNKPCVLDFTIRKAYDYTVVFNKSENFLPNTSSVININSFVLSPYESYQIYIKINDETYDFGYLSNYMLPDYLVFEPYLTDSEYAFLPDEPEGYMLLNQIDIYGYELNLLTEQQKEAVFDWVKLGGVLRIKNPDYVYRNEDKKSDSKKVNELYADYFKSPLYKYIGVPGRLYGEQNMEVFSEFVFTDWEVSEFNVAVFIPLIIVTALILGPGIVIYSKKKNKPLLMLVLIPALSIIFSIALFIISMLQYGIVPNVSNTSVAYLDQITGEVIINQLTGIESPLGGPQVEFPEDAYVNPVNNLFAGCRAADGKLVFNSNSVPAKIPVFFHMKRIYSDPRKLEITRKDNKITVMNGLGTAINYLKIGIDEGMVVYEQEIQAGESLEIDIDKYHTAEYSVPLNNIGIFGPYDSLNNFYREELAAGVYEAGLENNVFGVEVYENNRVEVGEGSNTIIGVYKDYR